MPDIDVIGTETTDLAQASIAIRSIIAAIGTEHPDIGEPDTAAPTVTVFYPAQTVTATGVIKFSALAADETTTQTVEILRDGARVGIFDGDGPHEVSQTILGPENDGTYVYSVKTTDTSGNTATYGPWNVTVAVSGNTGTFVATLAVNKPVFVSADVLQLSAGVSAGTVVTEIVIERAPLGGVFAQFGSAITSQPYIRNFSLASNADNGTFDYRVKVTNDAAQVVYSASVRVTVSIPAAPSNPDGRVIDTGLADMAQVDRRDTTRAFIFDMKSATTGQPISGVAATVQISRGSGDYEDPTGQVTETGLPGKYVFWPSAEDVGQEGRLSIIVRAPGAVTQERLVEVVTPYGKR